MRAAMDPDLDLALRCAWLSLVGGYTHEEIAARVATSRVKVTRLIQSAQRAGLVKVSIEGAPARCAALEEALVAQFGLVRCSVAPDLGEPGLPLSALGTLGAHVIRAALERDGIDVIGLGHGRTLAACVDALPLIARPRLKIVSLLGSLTRDAATTPYDVIFKLASRTGGTGYCLATPLVCASEADRGVFLAQRDTVAAQLAASKASITVAGIGAIDRDNGLVTSGMIAPAELDALAAAGAVGEVLGAFVDRDGRPLDIELTRRIVAVAPDMLVPRRVIAIAGGPGKAAAIAAVLRSGRIGHLVTDETTAQALAEPVLTASFPTFVR